MESSGGDKPTATDATESLVGLDGEETLSERESVGARHGPALPNDGGKVAPSTSSSAGNKRKHDNLGSNQMEVNEPGVPSSSSGDSTWSIDSLDDRRPLSLSRNKNGHSEHSVTSAGVTVIRQPRGVLRLRKLAQNVNTESWTGGHNIPQANGVPRSSQRPRRNKKGGSVAFQENRIGGDEPVSCLRTENGTCDQDTGTKFCSETEFSVEKQSHLSGEPSKAVHVDKGGCDHVKDDGVSLEENAARMLCSLSDNRCAGSPRKGMKTPDKSSKRSFPQHSNHFKNSYKKIKDVPGPARSLRKRDGKVPFRKRRARRHFYEVSPSDVDPFCIVKERIRVFWPLDETWYFGLVKEYNPVTRLHHVRYDDKDEEWINLQNERIKLLFLPAEARNRSKCTNSRSVFEPKNEHGDREDMDGSNTESSESSPISSWLARSNQAKSATLCAMSKQDHKHSNTVAISFDQKQCRGCDAKESNDSILCSSHANGGAEILKDRTTPEDRRFRFVYSRKRFCRKRNGFLSISEQRSNCQRRESSAIVLAASACPSMESSNATGASVTYVIPALSLPVKPVYKLLCEACCVSVSNAFFLLQCGTLVALWPVVHLDILLVDNDLGSKHFLVDTCLRSAVSLLCLLAGSFKQCTRQRATKELRIPCTSIRFQISGGHVRSQVVFMFFSFVGVEKSKWKHIQRKLQYQCSKELSNDYTKCTDQRAVSSMDLFSKGSDVQESVFLPEANYSDIEPVVCCLDVQCKFTRRVLDMTSAPSLLLWHHKKLLTGRNSTNGSQQSMSCTLDEDQQHLVMEHESIVHHAPPQVCALNLGSSLDSPLDMASASCANPSSSASRESKIAERNVSPDCNVGSIGDASIMHREFQDQNGPCIGADKLCSSNLSVICSSHKSAESRLSISVPEDKAIDAPNDKPLDNDEKEKQPISNLVQELIEHPIGRVTPTAPRTTYHKNRFTSISRAFGDGSKLLPEDHVSTGFAGGSKKPRSQVSYSVSPRSEELGLKSKGHFHKIQSHVSAKTNDSKKLLDSSRSEHSSPESLTCVANVLVTVGDRGWREYDTQITMDSDGQSERRICVKLAEGTKYAHKVCQVLQPGATNRYTHAMMWKGGAEWCLEFPDRSQWLIFKQMHDECYSHNIRAASVRNIPIPGVRLVEIHDDNDMVSFVQSEDYVVHIGTDVEIALDQSRVLYDMDSDDEEWMSSWQKSLVRDNTTLELAEDLFERVMDKLEKFAYSHNCNELTIDQMKELDIDDVPLDIIEVIHTYWRDKRQKKGMPLIRHFQSAMWKIYEQQLHEWESKVYRMQGSSNGYQEKKLPPKPPLFAFCLRPRGLHVPYKGPKQRSHKKLMSTGCHSFSREHDGFYRQVSGRRYNEYTVDGRICESYDTGSLYSPTGYSPRFSTRTDSPRAFDSERSSTPRFLRTNSVKRSASHAFSDDHQPSPSFRSQRVKRSAHDHWSAAIQDWQNSKHLFPGSSRVDIEELKLRDAASAAQHAAAMAKLKKEKAHCLMQKADLALHKATVALMIADAIKSSSRDTSRDGRRDLRNEER